MSSTDDQGQGQDPFNDPTAPAPDAPLTPPYAGGPSAGAEPPNPYPTQPPTPRQEPYGQHGEYGAPPAYGQQPYGEALEYGQPSPYGQAQPPAYGQQPYGEGPAYGQPSPYGQAQPPTYGQPPAYGSPLPGPYASGPGAYGVEQRNTSALTLTILSGISILCCGGIFSIPALVFGIIALTKQTTDPTESRRMTKFGWIAFAVGVAILVVVAGIFIAIAVAGGFDTSSTYEGY